MDIYYTHSVPQENITSSLVGALGSPYISSLALTSTLPEVFRASMIHPPIENANLVWSFSNLSTLNSSIIQSTCDSLFVSAATLRFPLQFNTILQDPIASPWILRTNVGGASTLQVNPKILVQKTPTQPLFSSLHTYATLHLPLR
jgi:hypothetical protein